MAHDVFISYSSDDKEAAEELSAYLEQQRIRCFVAHQDIASSTIWEASIVRAVENCKLMIVVLSENYSRSPEVDIDLKTCSKADKPILLFKIQKPVPGGGKKGLLKSRPFINAYPNPGKSYGKLLKELQKFFFKLRNDSAPKPQAAEPLSKNQRRAARKAQAEIQQVTARKEQAKRLAEEKDLQRIEAAKAAAEALLTCPPADDTTILAQAFTDASPYLVIDLSGGPYAAKYPVRHAPEPPDLDNDTCRTTELWFRQIPPGTFMMGSPPNEVGRHVEAETLHEVTLTKPFYIGVFHVTQKQYEQVTGTAPSSLRGETRPVTNISYDILRGKADGSQWPTHNRVDAASFFGKLRAKIPLTADLPTEAQWEYACRAGTATALNSGKNLTDRDKCSHLNEVGRYRLNTDNRVGGYSGGAHTKVGMYLPNAWGLYDMHGNVWEQCLDWSGPFTKASATDPKGALPKWYMGVAFGSRSERGGSYLCNAARCRSAHRLASYPNISDKPDLGFRAAIVPKM